MLHVSTWSKIYQIALQRCNRYRNCRWGWSVGWELCGKRCSIEELVIVLHLLVPSLIASFYDHTYYSFLSFPLSPFLLPSLPFPVSKCLCWFSGPILCVEQQWPVLPGDPSLCLRKQSRKCQCRWVSGASTYSLNYHNTSYFLILCNKKALYIFAYTVAWIYHCIVCMPPMCAHNDCLLQNTLHVQWFCCIF